MFKGSNRLAFRYDRYNRLPEVVMRALYSVMAGLVPAISLRLAAPCLLYGEGGTTPGHDELL